MPHHNSDKAQVLIVEDEPFIALDLAMAVEDAGGVVVGPVGSVREALAILQSAAVSGAILDVDLSDRDITPVAKLLIWSDIPTIFATGVGLPPELQARHSELIVYAKPANADVLVERLMALIRQRGARAEVIPMAAT